MADKLYIKECTAPQGFTKSLYNKSNVFFINEKGTHYMVYSKSKEDFGPSTSLQIYEYDTFEECVEAFAIFKAELQYVKEDPYYTVIYGSTDILQEGCNLVQIDSYTDNNIQYYTYIEVISEKRFDLKKIFLKFRSLQTPR